MAKQKSMYFINEYDKILEFIETKSKTMFDYMKANTSSDFFLFYKYITHSDLTSCGKRNERQGFNKNFLYYLTAEENAQIGSEQSTAHQSCISCCKEFYETFGIPAHRSGSQQVDINNYANVYVVNDTLKYFNSNYTSRVISALNRNVPSWVNKNNDISIDPSTNFTPISITRAAHGFGVERNTEFHKLRKSIFKNDIFMLLIEKTDAKVNIFILLEKNPIFFTIIKESNEVWQQYAEKQQQKIENILKTNKLTEEDVKSRAQQSPWKTKLAEEMMNYTTVKGEVFCPFTYIKGQFENLSSLFIASHIKRFEDCDSPREAWDVNNGLLLCANADALFDKHLITIDENKNLVFSFLIDNDILLKQQLLLLQPIFKIILNDERMNYLEDHRRMFMQKEGTRKGKNPA